MSELTFVTCPTCGLPAEFLPAEFLPSEFLPSEFLPSEFLLSGDDASAGAGDEAQRARIRCINMHVSIISPGNPAESTDAPPPASAVHPEVPADAVVAFPDPGQPSRRAGALGRIRQALSACSWRPAWFLVGALAAILAIEAPLFGIGAGILALLTLPVTGLLSARRPWANLVAPACPAWPEPVRNQPEEGLRAA